VSEAIVADVRYDHATRVYPGSVTAALNDFELHINDGEFMVFVGPSGSGKTTALRMLAGLEEVDGGAIWIGDRDVTDVAPKNRDIAMVFQNYALYPYLTVAENIAFPLTMAKVNKAECTRRVAETAEMLGLTEFLERKPYQLSGGQRQRVAMGRAVIRSPSVYLMDEPLSNLDAQLRVQMRSEIGSLQARMGVTTIYVTHDQSEAMTLGHRVAVLRDGELQQCATPRELYDRPVNSFVGAFIGSPAMNLITVKLDAGDQARLADSAVPVPLPRDELGPAASVVLGIRPESMELADEGIDATVEVVEELGADAFVFARALVDGQELKLVARVSARHRPVFGEAIRLRPRVEDAHLFHAVTGDRIER
jgi:multiple sugar transport system ATP-binding protein